MINIVYLENGLTPQLRKEVAIETTSIRNVAPDWSIPYVAFLNGKAVLRKDWDTVLEGEHCLAFIEAAAIPQGGGGGGGTDPLRIVLMIAVIYIAVQTGIYVGGGEAGTLGWSAGAAAATQASVAVLGMALVDAILPVKPLSSQQQEALASPSPTYNVRAQGNSARINAAIPEHFGRLQCYPDFAAQPYSEYVDNEQYVYQLLCIGRGEYDIESVKIEDTPIHNFNDVEIFPTAPNTVFTAFSTKVTNCLEVAGQEVQSFNATYTSDGSSSIITVKLVDHGLTLSSIINVTFKASEEDPGTEYKEISIISSVDSDTFTISAGGVHPATTTGMLVVTPILGYFIANMADTPTNLLKFDFIAPRGLYKANDDGSLANVTVYPVMEVRPVDSYGNFMPGSSWTGMSTTTDLGWASWSDTSSSNTYIAPPTNTTLVEYQVMASYYGFVDSGDSSSYEYIKQVVVGPVMGETTYNKWGFVISTSVRTDVLYTIQQRSKRVVQSSQKSGATTTPQRWTVEFPVASGRYACRVYRSGVSAASSNSRIADSFVWGGLRAYHPNTGHHGDVTLLGVKMRASNNLSVQSSRKINVLATRKLQELEWSVPLNKTILGTNKVPTRRVDSAIVYAAKQIGMTDAQIDFNSIARIGYYRALESEFFDGRFDNFVSFWEAISKMAAVVRSKPFLQAGILRIIRDEAASIPTAMFSQRNIVKNSLSINYILPTEDTAKKVAVKYFDNINWQPGTVNAYLGPTDPQTTPAVLDMFGITSRTHAYKEGLYHAATNLYRRKIIKFQTEMEGFIPTFGDLIVIQHDLPAWGQSGEVVGWDAPTKTLTLSEAPTWTGTQTHYIALRTSVGTLQGDDCFIVTKHASDPLKVVIGASKSQGLQYGYTPYTNFDRERTHYAFGPGEAWRQPAKVLSVRPQSFTIVEIECINDDSAVYTVEQNSVPPAPIVYTNLNSITAHPSIPFLLVDRVAYYPTKLDINWNPAPWADYYIIEQQDSAGNFVHVKETRATTAQIDILNYSGASVRIAAVNMMGTGSWVSALIPPPIPPSLPTEVTYKITRNGIQLKWPAVADYTLVTYELRKGTNWDTAELLVNTASTDYLIEKHAVGVAYNLLLKSIDNIGTYSKVPLSLPIDVIPPANYDIFTVTFDDAGTRFINFGYTDGLGGLAGPIDPNHVPVDLAGAVIRYAVTETLIVLPTDPLAPQPTLPTWDSMLPVHDGLLTSSYETTQFTAGNYIFAIKAVDLVGNYSTDPLYLPIFLPPVVEAVVYKVEVESSNGDEFRVGEASSTVLIAHVFKNGLEITDTIDASRFKWRRVSEFPLEVPYDDITWNNTYGNGYKQVVVNIDSINARATFHCDIMSA